MCLSVQNWFNSPISWQEEKKGVLAVSAIVVAIIALGTICYTYQGGRFADIPGYNQYYGIACWSLGGAIALGTIISYIAKSILSAPKPAGPYQPRQTVKIEELALSSLEDACKGNANFARFIQGISLEDIPQLTEEETSQPLFTILIELTSQVEGLYKRHGIESNSLLAVFEEKRSAFLAGREPNGAWFIVARIILQKPGKKLLDGICLLVQGEREGINSPWYPHIGFFNCDPQSDWDAHEIRQRRFYVGFDHDPAFPHVPAETQWIQAVLQGEEKEFKEMMNYVDESEHGKVYLWKPASKT